MDYYKILGVNENATDSEIKKAYRTLAMKYHPDTNKESGSDIEFKKINEAYSTLSDRDKKLKYDMMRNFGLQDDFINNTRNHYQSPFESYGFNRTRPKKGTSLNINMQINLHDVLYGMEKKIKINSKKRCKTCHGEGGTHQVCGECKGTGFFTYSQQREFVSINSTMVCTACNGKGKVILEACLDCKGTGLNDSEEIIDIKIPAGASDGMQFIIENKGNESVEKNGKNGDLYVRIKEIADQRFRRNGIDLISTVEITFIDAVLGTNIDIQMPNGKVLKAVIDPGTVPGTILKFAQKGIPNLGYGGIGNFLVEITIKVPKINNEDDKKFLKKLKNNEIFK